MTGRRDPVTPETPGFCRSVAQVRGEDWWPGRFIFKPTEFTTKSGVLVRQVLGLCPLCGKWVPVNSGSMIAHTQPAGTDRRRMERAAEARIAYEAMVERDRRRRESALVA